MNTQTVSTDEIEEFCIAILCRAKFSIVLLTVMVIMATLLTPAMQGFYFILENGGS